MTSLAIFELGLKSMLGVTAFVTVRRAAGRAECQSEKRRHRQSQTNDLHCQSPRLHLAKRSRLPHLDPAADRIKRLPCPWQAA